MQSLATVVHCIEMFPFWAAKSDRIHLHVAGLSICIMPLGIDCLDLYGS